MPAPPDVVRRMASLKVDTSLCKYSSVRRAADSEEEYNEGEEPPKTWTICWTDTSVNHERVAALGPLQKLNHFVDMILICRKAQAAMLLNHCAMYSPKEFAFHPRSWSLPRDLVSLTRAMKSDRPPVVILKPNKGSQGAGISICRSLHEFDAARDAFVAQGSTAHGVAQEYMGAPLLLDGYKFDLRLYVLVTSCSPLRIHLYRDGLARLCTEKYPTSDRGDSSSSSSAAAHNATQGERELSAAAGVAAAKSTTDWRKRHLTNFAINRHHKEFRAGEGGAKRRLGDALDTLRSRYGLDVECLWGQIQQLVVKTILAVQPHVAHAYASCRPSHSSHPFSCFELLGFDLLLDAKGRPFLLEVNHSPSLACDSELDRELKDALLADTMRLAAFSAAEERVLRPRPSAASKDADPRTALPSTPRSVKRAVGAAGAAGAAGVAGVGGGGRQGVGAGGGGGTNGGTTAIGRGGGASSMPPLDRGCTSATAGTAATSQPFTPRPLTPIGAPSAKPPTSKPPTAKPPPFLPAVMPAAVSARPETPASPAAPASPNDDMWARSAKLAPTPATFGQRAAGLASPRRAAPARSLPLPPAVRRLAVASAEAAVREQYSEPEGASSRLLRGQHLQVMANAGGSVGCGMKPSFVEPFVGAFADCAEDDDALEHATDAEPGGAFFPSPMRPTYVLGRQPASVHAQIAARIHAQGIPSVGPGGGDVAPTRSVAHGLHMAKLIGLRAAYEDALERDAETEFERVFPSPHPELQSVYLELLRRSQRCLQEERLASDGAWGGGGDFYPSQAEAERREERRDRGLDLAAAAASPNQPSCYAPHEFAVLVDGNAPSARTGNLARSIAAREAVAEAEEAAAAAAALERAAAEAAKRDSGEGPSSGEEEDDGSDEDDAATQVSGGAETPARRLGRLLKKAKKAKRPRSKKKRPKKKIRSMYVPYNQLV